MRTFFASTFDAAFSQLDDYVKHYSAVIHTEKWQGLSIQKNPAARMREVYLVGLQVPVGLTPLKVLRSTIKPNLPWADDHFLLERVSGEPINPGTTWKSWPWGNSADKFRSEGEAFNHSYAERYWPKFATLTPGGYLANLDSPRINRGLRYNYGDLMDVVNLLHEQPLTRQAYLPVFFPEDTGAVHGGRVPCSIGYHFLCRDNQLHVTYQLRSCDYYRHFRDDVYLTIRLLLWVLEKLGELNANWLLVRPGIFNMMIGSLHLFENDYRVLYGKK